MSRPLVVDCFPFNDELDMLECRLVELFDAVDYFVLVEANVTHQDTPKPLHYWENRARFEPWRDKLRVIAATGLPNAVDFPDPWAREHAQREYIGPVLAGLELDADAVILQSDVDEIPTALHARNVRPSGLLAFEQRLHCFALEWQHPQPWRGTVATRYGALKNLGTKPFGRMRDSRNTAACPPHLRDAGWHLSWMGGRDAALRKLDAFCHPEIADRTRVGIERDDFIRNGWHVDGVRMSRREIDDTYPQWIIDGREPESWHHRAD